MTQEFAVRPRVEIDGSALSAELEALLEQVIVDDHLHTPDMFEVRFRDAERGVLSQARLKIGSKLMVAAPPLGGSAPDVLISGEVTALEGEYDSAGSLAVVRGYDLSHRLHMGRVSKTYVNMKYSDIAQQVAGDHGLQAGTIDDSKAVCDHVFQHNLTDWEFLRDFAEKIGFEVAVTDDKLHFRQPTQASNAPDQGDYQSSNPLQLVFGQDLVAFYPRISSSGQVKEIKVRGWDPINKQAILASASAGTSSTDLPTTPADLAGAFGGGRILTIVDRTLSNQAAAEAKAKAARDQIGSSAAEAEGIARGNPKLKAGQAVSVSAVSKEFVGRYTLTHTRHVFDAHGYRTHFTVSGSQDRSLLGLVWAGASGG